MKNTKNIKASELKVWDRILLGGTQEKTAYKLCDVKKENGTVTVMTTGKTTYSFNENEIVEIVAK